MENGAPTVTVVSVPRNPKPPIIRLPDDAAVSEMLKVVPTALGEPTATE
jgi:hypothetical protein